MMDYTEFCKTIVWLAALYPNFTLKPESVDAYYAILKDLPSQLLQAAAQQVGATSKWFPAASELRAAAAELMNHNDGVLTAAQAWSEVMHEVHNGGVYGNPHFSHPLVYRAVEAMGGWMDICLSETEMADRAHFLKIYADLLGRERYEQIMPPQVSETVKRLAAGLHMFGPDGRVTQRIGVGKATNGN